MSETIAIYARYSSDLQSQSSIEDQIRLSTEYAESRGWAIFNCYTDAGISGASMKRPGIQALMQDAMEGKFSAIVCEALDRLSRDQEDIAGLYKRMEFAGVKILTLSEGEINTMHIGLKGTMNAMYLKDLADKTRRGLRGRVEKGKSAGSIGYGYRVLKSFDALGEPVRGEREINETEAKVVLRIFEDYAHKNHSPKAIALKLNEEGIPSPSGGLWSQSTINGNRKRGTGILNNELYIGKLVWNRQTFVKNPVTGKRVTRINDESLWQIQEVPELRIVPQSLWEAAKARQANLTHNFGELQAKRRARNLLSGLLECSCCGGGFSKISKDHYGCSSARNKGKKACSNLTTIRQDVLETSFLNALKTQLMRDDLLEVFCDEYTQHMNKLHNAQDAALKSFRQEFNKLQKERESLVQALKDGVPAALVKDDLIKVSARLEELEGIIETQRSNADKPLLHPSMATRYKEQVLALQGYLEDKETKSQSFELIRALVDKIVLTPKEDSKELSIDLYGDLAGVIAMSLKTNDNGKSGAIDFEELRNRIVNDNNALKPQVKLVAGAHSQLYLLSIARDITAANLATVEELRSQSIPENPYHSKDADYSLF